MKFNRNILEGYLAVVLVLLTTIAFMILRVLAFEQNPGAALTNILLILLISVQILITIILLRILEKIGKK